MVINHWWSLKDFVLIGILKIEIENMDFKLDGLAQADLRFSK